LQKTTIRRSLTSRRELYWAAPIATGKYIGFRRIDEETGSWIAGFAMMAGASRTKRWAT
jgi:hypothetical protein